ETTVETSEVEQELAAALREYLRDPSLIGAVLERNPDLPVLARALHALPVYADIGGALLITTAGKVLLVHSNQAWDESAEFEVETRGEWVREAFASCASRFPALTDVVKHLTAASNTSLART